MRVKELIHRFLYLKHLAPGPSSLEDQLFALLYQKVFPPPQPSCLFRECQQHVWIFWLVTKKNKRQKNSKEQGLNFYSRKIWFLLYNWRKKKKKRCELFELDYTLGISPQLYGSFNPSNTLEWLASNFSLQYHPLITH